MLADLLALLGRALDFATENVLLTLVAVIVGTFLFMSAASALAPAPKTAEYTGTPCGDITAATLRKFCGRDPYLPIYFAVRGEIFDVTRARDFYGPGKEECRALGLMFDYTDSSVCVAELFCNGAGYAVFAGREVSRALGLMSLEEEDCCSELADLTPRQLDILQEWTEKFRSKYPVVGKVVPEKRLTLQQLAEYDGSEPKKPILLAIRGTVFDVTKGKEYYGPDGVYPFAGRECARALAMQSTELNDCRGDLEGLDKMELDNLREWQGRFHSKYDIVGSIVDKPTSREAPQQAS